MCSLIDVFILKEISRLRNRGVCTCALRIALFLLFSRETVIVDDTYSTSIYGAAIAGNSLGRMFLSPDPEKSYYLFALAWNLRVASCRKCIDFEVEG